MWLYLIQLARALGSVPDRGYEERSGRAQRPWSKNDDTVHRRCGLLSFCATTDRLMRGSLRHVVQRHHIPDWKMAGVQVLMSAEVTGLQLPPRAYARRNEARKGKKKQAGTKQTWVGAQ
jgi:hypothetical protein